MTPCAGSCVDRTRSWLKFGSLSSVVGLLASTIDSTQSHMNTRAPAAVLYDTGSVPAGWLVELKQQLQYIYIICLHLPFQLY